jgi:hypothetical protein
MVLTGFSLGISSCKKKDPTPAAASYVYADDVYIAGKFSNAQGTFPSYWKNGKRVNLKALDNTSIQPGEVTAITVNGTDVYAVGYCYPATGQIILWKNEKAIKVTENDGSFANGIAVSGTDVYVVGAKPNANAKNAATYWKISGSSPINPIDLTQNTYPNNNLDGCAITVLNGKVYVTGTKFNNVPANNNVLTQAVLWTDDGTIITSSILGTNLAYGTTIAISGTHVYIGGVDNNTVKFWKDNTANFSNLGTMNYSSMYPSCSIAVDANDTVYMAGDDNSGAVTKAMYWNSNGTAVTLTAPSTSTDEHAHSIALAGNNVYVTGQSNSNRSILWVNGKKVPGFDGSQDIYAPYLFVVKK